MKISIIGGTGKLGMGLGARWLLAGYSVIIGSRREPKAKAAAREVLRLASKHGSVSMPPEGYHNTVAAEKGDIIVLSVPYVGLDAILESVKRGSSNKIVISPIVPVTFERGRPILADVEKGSVAEHVQSALPDSKVVSAFHTLSFNKLLKLGEKLDEDVVICGDDDRAKGTVKELIESIPDLRGLDGGPLRNSSIVERLTFLIFEISRNTGKEDLGIKFV